MSAALLCLFSSFFLDIFLLFESINCLSEKALFFRTQQKRRFKHTETRLRLRKKGEIINYEEKRKAKISFSFSLSLSLLLSFSSSNFLLCCCFQTASPRLVSRSISYNLGVYFLSLGKKLQKISATSSLDPRRYLCHVALRD